MVDRLRRLIPALGILAALTVVVGVGLTPTQGSAVAAPKKTTTTRPATTTTVAPTTTTLPATTTVAPTTTTAAPTTTLAPTTTVAPTTTAGATTTTTAPPPAAVGLRAAPASTTDAGGIVTVKAFTTPAAAVAGDTLVATLDYKTPGLADIANTAPTGWTKVPGEVFDVSTTTGTHLVVATKPATGGTETPLWSFASAPAGLVITVGAYSGVDPAAPFEKSGYKVEAGGSSTTVHTAPVFTPAVTGSWGFAAFGARASETWTPGAGLVERSDVRAATSAQATLETDDSNGTLPTGSPITYTASEPAGTSVQASFAGNLQPVQAPPASTTTTETSLATTTSTTIGTGDQIPPIGAGWTMAYSNTFEAGSNLTDWGLYDGPYGSDPFNWAKPSHVTISGGSLHLLMAYDTSGGAGAAWYTGGMQLSNSYASINQQITLRYRVVLTDPVNVRAHRNIPMHWGNEPPNWPANGEIDYAEGSGLNDPSTFIHYGTSSPGTTVSHDYIGLGLDLSQWNIIRAERDNHTVRVFWNDLVTPAYTFNGDSTSIPDNLQRVVLQQECRSVCPDPSYAGQTEDIQVAWITVANK